LGDSDPQKIKMFPFCEITKYNKEIIYHPYPALHKTKRKQKKVMPNLMSGQ
jgi:hypothetical protein